MQPQASTDNSETKLPDNTENCIAQTVIGAVASTFLACLSPLCGVPLNIVGYVAAGLTLTPVTTHAVKNVCINSSCFSANKRDKKTGNSQIRNYGTINAAGQGNGVNLGIDDGVQSSRQGSAYS
ncbi:MAG: hypothetical protein ABSF18_00980 [Gammaproteobacteria bacterium]|jgi:hypothetical protein